MFMPGSTLHLRIGKPSQKRDFMWIRAPFVQQRTVVKKTVVFGHTPAKDIHGKADVWFDRDKIGIDGGCAYGFQINCLEIKGGISTRPIR